MIYAKVASPGFADWGHETEKNNFKGDTTTYQVYAISSDTNYGADVPEYAQYAMLGFLLDRQPDEVKCQSLCGSEMTWKINSWKLRVLAPVSHA